MEEVRKWRVTYTKHLNQKRKLYQDGFLHLLSNYKVVLYDECEKLLDCKFLKKDEAVRAGESMAFSSFLVDIGDPESSSTCILLPDPKSESNSRTSEIPRNILPNKKPNISSRKTSANNLSPSRKIIREFKKNEVIKYSSHHSPSSVTASSFKEWEALYTTQITQKAKKYHDGFIHLIICGSQARQVALYDSSKTQIDKRFLKKDEVICSGESLKFDGYLVDIGDALGNTGNDADVKKGASNYNSDQVKSENLVYNPQRCKEPTRQNHLSTGNAVKIGEPRNDVGPRKCLDSSFDGSRVDKMKPMKTPLSLMPPRDVHHILSILKKPAAQDIVSILENAAVKQCLSQSSEVVLLDIDGKPFEGIAQFDRHQTPKVTNKYDGDEAAKRGSTQTWSTGDHPPQPETNDNIATAQANTDCSSNNIERPVFTQGAAFESPNKSEPSIGTAPSNKLQASVNHRQSVICQPIHLAGFMGSISPGSQETRFTYQQPYVKLPETNASSIERTSPTSNKPKARRPFSERNGMKIMRNNVNAEFSLGTLDCPSFDLGI